MNKKELQELSDKLRDDWYFLLHRDLKSTFERIGLIHLLPEIEEKSLEVRSKLDNITAQLKDLQDNCKGHIWQYTGHGSHKNYYECEYCGAENWD